MGNLWEVSPSEWAVERENNAIEEEVEVEGAEIGKAGLVKLMVEGELVEAGKMEKGEGEMEGKREDKGDKPTPGGIEEVVVRKYGPLSDNWGTDLPPPAVMETAGQPIWRPWEGDEVEEKEGENYGTPWKPGQGEVVIRDLPWKFDIGGSLKCTDLLPGQAETNKG